MVNHCQFIVERFNLNHAVLASEQLFQDEAVLHQLDNNPNCVVVTYPWSSNGGSFAGVPPHVAVLQELHSLKVKQQSLIDNFISKVKTAIEECDLAGGSLSEHTDYDKFLMDFQQIFVNNFSMLVKALKIQRQTMHNTLKQGKDIVGIILMVISTMFQKIGAFLALVFLTHGSSGGLVILFRVFHH